MTKSPIIFRWMTLLYKCDFKKKNSNEKLKYFSISNFRNSKTRLPGSLCRAYYVILILIFFIQAEPYIGITPHQINLTLHPRIAWEARNGYFCTPRFLLIHCMHWCSQHWWSDNVECRKRVIVSIVPVTYRLRRYSQKRGLFHSLSGTVWVTVWVCKLKSKIIIANCHCQIVDTTCSRSAALPWHMHQTLT